MKLAFKIAVRFLKSSKGQTALIVLGIAVGVSVQIFIGSLIQGLQGSLINKTIGNSPQITISSDTEEGTIENYKEITQKISSKDRGIINLSVTADGPALIKEENKNFSVLIRGMNLKDSDKIYNIKERIYQGSEPEREKETIIGRELQEELGIELGDKIEILANSGQIEKLKVTGFYDLKVASLNKTWMITTLETAQNIFLIDDKVTAIEMQVEEVFDADLIADDLSKVVTEDYKIENWKVQNAELLSGLNGQSISSIMIQIFVLVAVVLGIASVLAITVIQKSRQIGILKAMGIKNRSASLIFLFEGLLLGIMGAILGVALGLGLGYMFTKFALNPDGTPVIELYIDYGFIGLSAVIALVSATLAALIPARRSSKLDPIEVIKNG
ncbi:MAG: ABC transporter permease [Eubacteriales bacterium]|nr:ABC transporter permease [Eubacteriales bacterium]